MPVDRRHAGNSAALSRPVRGLGPAGPVGWPDADCDDLAVRHSLRGRTAVGGGQAAAASPFQPQPADGQPACRVAPAAPIDRAEHDGGQHPPRHGLLPSARASESILPTRLAQTRPDESSGPPVLQSSKSIAQAPSTQRMPLAATPRRRRCGPIWPACCTGTGTTGCRATACGCRALCT